MAPTEIGNTTYTTAQIGALNGRADARNFAPGYSHRLGRPKSLGFMLGGDVGVLFPGKVRLSRFQG